MQIYLNFTGKFLPIVLLA